MTFLGQKMSTYYSELTPMTGRPVISADILYTFRTLRLFRKWDKGIDINSDGETLYTTYYDAEFLMYVEKEYCAKHR
jgi:hypothetical protein